MINTAAIAVALSLQATSSAPLAMLQEDAQPERWEVAYDIAMMPYVDDYQRCLGYGNRIFSGAADIEEQHRADLPRCAKVAEESVAASNTAIALRGRSDLMTPEDVSQTFMALGQIHIERGRDFDNQFTLQMRAVEAAQARYQAQIEARDRALTVENVENAGNP